MATGANAFRVAESGVATVDRATDINVSTLTVGENLGSLGTYNISGGTLNVNEQWGALCRSAEYGRRTCRNRRREHQRATVNLLNGAQMMLGMGTNNSTGF
jgi:hypothetical protein